MLPPKDEPTKVRKYNIEKCYENIKKRLNDLLDKTTNRIFVLYNKKRKDPNFVLHDGR